MSQKFVTYTLDDLAFDHEAVAKTLNQACTGRGAKFRVTGICNVDNRVCFVLAPLADGAPQETYVLAAGEDMRHDALEGTLGKRWSAGFNTIGSICIDRDLHLVLYAKQK